MDRVKGRYRTVVWRFLVFGCRLLLATAAPAAPPAGAALTTADCQKCHDRQPQEIEAKGAAHKTAIDCLACHESHRPKVAKNIPECSNCHSGTPHYEIKGCQTCHNPHSPLEITLKGELKAVCLTCHEGPGKDLAANPSKHTEVACNFCHADKHGVIPDCISCHEPHSKQMTQADCKTCHQAHKPLALTYGTTVPSVQCAACHDQAFALLNASQTKHRDLACVACHADKHKMVPQCADCHGQPHAAGMHQKFPQCGDCHNIAHDLNNWAGQGGAKAPQGTKPQPAGKPQPATKK
jgi:predicted CXXCH cytochrome family protein